VNLRFNSSAWYVAYSYDEFTLWKIPDMRYTEAAVYGDLILVDDIMCVVLL
jgi:hypothetical protein